VRPKSNLACGVYSARSLGAITRRSARVHAQSLPLTPPPISNRPTDGFTPGSTLGALIGPGVTDDALSLLGIRFPSVRSRWVLVPCVVDVRRRRGLLISPGNVPMFSPAHSTMRRFEGESRGTTRGSKSASVPTRTGLPPERPLLSTGKIWDLAGFCVTPHIFRGRYKQEGHRGLSASRLRTPTEHLCATVDPRL